ncbi:FmdB family zinc ribbon protein [Desulfomarina sp.]
MPIYEFYCKSCNVIYNFFSARVNTEKVPDCPGCGREKLSKQISTFATIGKAENNKLDMLAGFDERKVEQAFESLMKESENINEDDPRQMASLMRSFSSQTGIKLGETMEEAIARMESGEDPEKVEKDLGHLLEAEDFSFDLVKGSVRKKEKPGYDEKLYEL